MRSRVALIISLSIAVAAAIIIALSIYFGRNGDVSHSDEKSPRNNLNSNGRIEAITEFIPNANPPKYFAIDIDNTLHTKNKESMERNIKVFKELMDKGYVPFFCTGRMRKSALSYLGDEFVEKTGYNGFPGIYHNGAVTYDENGLIIKTFSFSREFLRAVYDYLNKKDMLNLAVFYTAFGCYTLKPLLDKLNQMVIIQNHPLPAIINKEVLFELEVVDFVLLQSGETVKFAGPLCGKDFIEKHGSSEFYVVAPPGATKAAALELLMKHMKNQDPSNCGFIGDGMNDIEAMRFSKLSFAVGNAPDDVKMHAKYTTHLTNDEAAFAKVLELVYGLSQKKHSGII